MISNGSNGCPGPLGAVQLRYCQLYMQIPFCLKDITKSSSATIRVKIISLMDLRLSWQGLFSSQVLPTLQLLEYSICTQPYIMTKITRQAGPVLQCTPEFQTLFYVDILDLFICMLSLSSVNEGDLVIKGNRTVNYLSLDIEGAELQVSWLRFSNFVTKFFF